MIDLVPIWTLVIGFGVFMYVLLDGFDLGVGILFPFARGEEERNLMMNSVAPVWDGNETWLVLGGTALLAVFPLAYAIIIPALYFPIALMLLGLILRGVAFEFRFKATRYMHWWNRSFFGGSLAATFFQGVVLGNFVRGFAVDGRHFAGSSFDWLSPFPLLAGLGLVCGYAMLGATWLVMKTEGELQQASRRQARWLLLGVLAFILMVSLWTPFMASQIAARWFTWPNMAYFAPVPVVTALIAWTTWHALASDRDTVPFLGARAVRDVLRGARDQPLSLRRAVLGHAARRRGVTELAGLPAGRHDVPAAVRVHLHVLVVLRVPRQGARGHRVSLKRAPMPAPAVTCSRPCRCSRSRRPAPG